MLCRESEDDTEEDMVCKRRRRDGSHHPEPGAYNVHSLQELPLGTYVEFLTDVEGNWEYFLHFIHLSKILHWEGEDRGAWGPGILTLRENGILVFGGDACDKGPGDIRFSKTLLSLKRRYWDSVFIILGNRDLNKIRFYAELAPLETGSSFEQRKSPYGAGVYWVNADMNMKYKDYLKKENAARDAAGTPLLEEGHLSTLHWMLDCNMGCQTTTFQTRKHELALLQWKSSDEDVVASFRDSVDPKGQDPWMLDLLRVGNLAVLIGDAMFVHAGLPDDCIGAVPGEPTVGWPNCTPELVGERVRDWVAELNRFKDREIEAFEKQPQWRLEEGISRRGGDVLIAYGNPGGFCNKSVAYHNPFRDGNPHLFAPKVEMALQAAKIKRVFSGHQPHGESPTVVRHPRTDLLAFTCDTSYSNMAALKLLNKADNRGDVVTMVRLDRAGVQLEGVLKDGSKHGCYLHCDASKDDMPCALVGRQLTDGSWVKTISSGNAVSALGEGFQVSTALHPLETMPLLPGVDAV